jgi:Asp-tRNA(Asn)/Glu-tRNA(Gln) amidotransferase A subunit family amidase
MRGEAASDFEWKEATIAGVQAAYASGRLTCTALVAGCLDRIRAYDRQGPSLGAIITLNPRAAGEAAEVDRWLASGRARPPLLGIPVVVKDNVDTADMPTTGGSVALAYSRPPDDACVVRRLRGAGAIVLGKTNLTELARGGSTLSSLGGQTRNPYDLTRTPGGSSGGTGAALAANFAMAGIGSDTLNSTRSPASATCLVGLRPTRGLISRDGLMPLSPTQDTVGPMARTVEDAARLLDVLAGYDPADPTTAASRGKVPTTYTAFLDRQGLKGARIGLPIELFGSRPLHKAVNAVVDTAAAAMADLGATTVWVTMPGVTDLTRDFNLWPFEFREAFNAYLAGLGSAAPVRTLDEFVALGRFHPSLRAGLEADARMVNGPAAPAYAKALGRRGELRKALMSLMVEHRLDAIVYPHQQRLVVPIGEEQVERNGVLASATGFPALTLPGGFSAATATAPLGVPVGIELLGPEWSEPTLFRLAYSFEHATNVRRAPHSVP